MKKYLLAAAILFTGCITQAQKSENDDDNKMNDYDEIIIKRKDAAKDGKVVIELRNQEVTVDGKPIDEYNGDDFIISKRRPKHYTLNSPASPFRLDGNNWSNDNDRNHGNEDKAFLGVLTEGSTEGAKVTKISENSAAEKAGLKNGDVILKINDKAVFDHEELSKAIASKKPGDKITITYKRDGKENKATATLGKRAGVEYYGTAPHGPMPYMAPGMPPMEFNFDGNGFHGLFGKPRLGIKAQDTEEGKGVRVADVDKDSPADKAGIKQNDIITSFEGKEVNSAEELAEISHKSNDKSSLKVQLKRNGKSQNVEIKVPRKLKTANI